MISTPRPAAPALHNPLRYRLHFFPAQYIAAVQPEHAASHEGSIAQDKHHGLNDVLDRAGAAEKGVVADCLLLRIVQKPPAAVPGPWRVSTKPSMISFTRTSGAASRAQVSVSSDTARLAAA